MANTLANRRYVEQLEADMKKLKQEKTAAEAIATLSDERMKSAYIQKDEVLNEKSRVQEQLAVCQVEKAALEEQQTTVAVAQASAPKADVEVAELAARFALERNAAPAPPAIAPAAVVPGAQALPPPGCVTIAFAMG